MHDLTRFGLEDMVRCGSRLRGLGAGLGHMEAVADRIVRDLYDGLLDGPSGARACALVRLYKTHPFGDLEPDLQAQARPGLGGREPTPSMKCLTLLATAGDEAPWNDRHRSAGHQAIPLFSREQVESIPMVAQLIRQFGLQTAAVLPDAPGFLLDRDQRTYNVFHVPQALGSPSIPAQAGFVIPHGIASVLGFGGLLPSGELLAVLLFSKVPIPAGTADFFKTIALSVKLALLPHDGTAVFARDDPATPPPARLADAHLHALAQLLDVQERTAMGQTRRLQAKNDELVDALRQLHEAQDRLVAKERLASLGALTAGIAHEIKNPLNFVTNFAQLSTDLIADLVAELDGQRDRLDAGVREDIADLLGDLKQNSQKIREHGQRADGIVSTMLLHSRGGTARAVATDPNPLLVRYTDLAYHGLRAQDPTVRVAVTTDLDPALTPVPLIAEHLGRVILNLVNNACYAAHKKHERLGDPFAPAVRVTSRALADRVEVRVRDNGDGIPEPIRARIFDPFYTTKPPGAGTGLGLSLSHDIVVGEHRGDLRVESLDGEWTEFIVTLPRAAPSP